LDGFDSYWKDSSLSELDPPTRAKSASSMPTISFGFEVLSSAIWTASDFRSFFGIFLSTTTNNHKETINQFDDEERCLWELCRVC
jgi:hypothetical protein